MKDNSYSSEFLSEACLNGERSLMFRWSIWTSWYYELPLEDALPLIVGAGFNLVELSAEHLNEIIARSFDEGEGLLDISSKNRALFFRRMLGTKYLSEYASLIKENGVIIVQAHGPFDTQFLASEEQRRDRELRKIEIWLRACCELEIPVLVMHPLQVGGMAKSLEVNVHFYKKVARIAEDYGVAIALENLGASNFGSRVDDLLRILKRVGKDSLRICIDTGHANLCDAYRGHVDRCIRESNGYLIATHLNDNDGTSDQHLFLGRGTIRWRLVFDSFKRVRYHGPLNLEIPGERNHLLSTDDRGRKLRELRKELVLRWNKLVS